MPNQQSKCKTNKWVKLNYEWRGWYNTNTHIKFKAAMLKSGLCDYGDAYILVNGTKTVKGAGTA